MLGFGMDRPRFVERARRAVPRESGPSQGDRQVGLGNTRSVRIAMHTDQLYLLRDHFGGAEKVRYQCEQHIFVRHRKRHSSGSDLGNRMRLEGTSSIDLSNDPSDAGRFQQISHTTHWM